MFEQLRTLYGWRVLKNAISRSRKVEVVNFATVRKCVVVLDESGIDKNRIHNVERILQAANVAMKIQFLTYAKKPNDRTTVPVEKLNVLYRRDLNWYFRPKSMSFGVCDLLIDLTLKPVLPLQFLTALSNANFKVGTDQLWNKEVLSLMIQSKEPEKIDFVIEQLVKYINMISKEKNAA